MYISETNCHNHIQFLSSEKKTMKVSFYARLTRMPQQFLLHVDILNIYFNISVSGCQMQAFKKFPPFNSV
jgi:hypothetical protein